MTSQLNRRIALLVLTSAVSAPLIGRAAVFPERPMRLIVPFRPAAPLTLWLDCWLSTLVSCSGSKSS